MAQTKVGSSDSVVDDQYPFASVQLQAVAAHPGVQSLSKAGSTHTSALHGDTRMVSNSTGPVTGKFRPSSLGNRQSQCPAKQDVVSFKVARKSLNTEPSGAG